MRIFRRLLPLFLILALLTSLSACTKTPTETQSSEEEKTVTEVGDYLKTVINIDLLSEYVSFNKDSTQRKYSTLLFNIDKDNYIIACFPNSSYEPTQPGESVPDKNVIFCYNVPSGTLTEIYNDAGPNVFGYTKTLKSDNGEFFLYGTYDLLAFDKDFNLKHVVEIPIKEDSYDSLKTVSPDGKSIVLADNKKLYIAELSDMSKRTELSELNFNRDAVFSSDGTKVFQPVHSAKANSFIGMEYVDIITGENKKLTCFTEGEFNAIGTIYPYDEAHMLVTVLQEGGYVGEGDLHFFLVDFVNDTRQELFVRKTNYGNEPKILSNSTGIYTVYRPTSDYETQRPAEYIDFEAFDGKTSRLELEEKRIIMPAVSENGESVFVIYENKDSENGFEAVIYTKK